MKYDKQYKTLKVGDVRMLGDEVRPLFNSRRNHSSTDSPNPKENWSHVNLIGHAILPADLFNAEFRRRLI